ncbi:MAG TPA: ketoacyl-ACP synthase III [Firmicutes bacterium]|nr:ketoacyl-ACP synthase III [Bacillota bacterium]
MSRRTRARIVGVGAAVGEQVLTNFDLEKMVDTSDEWIVTRTGIRERRIARPDVATSDLAVAAAREALVHAGLGAAALDMVIVGTVTPDMPFPCTACLVASRLGIPEVPAFDLSSGCTGFLYACATAASFLDTGLYRHILVIGGDTLSRIVDWQDRSTCVLFGDGVGAAVLVAEEGERGFLGFRLGSDADKSEHLSLPAGGSRLPASAETVAGRLHYVRMDGQEVFKFAVRATTDASLRLLEELGLAPEAVDLFIPHQANRRIVDAAVQRLGFPPEKVMVNLERYGNMSAGSIPVALDEAIRCGRVKEGDLLLMVAFGAGLSWAAAACRW